MGFPLNRILLVALSLLTVGYGQICNATDPSDTPSTTGCSYCQYGTNEGCEQGGICYPRPIAPGSNVTIPFCSCPYGHLPPQCAVAGVFPLCNASDPTDSPLNGAACNFCVPGTNENCFNGGICYIRPLDSPPAPPGTAIPICGCSYEWGIPNCLAPAPAVPLCDPSEPTQQPPSCEFCDLTTNEGCANGGTCYLANLTGPQYPPNFQTPVCGCTYDWAPPTCRIASVPAPLCDPYNSTVGPPFCEYCRLGTSTFDDGCRNFGRCELQNITSPGAPPNFQTPVCSCQTGWVPPTCADTLYNASLPNFGDHIAFYTARWTYVVMYLVSFVLAVLCLIEYAVKGKKPRPTSHKSNMYGLVMVAIAGLAMTLYFGINQNGIAFGYSHPFIWFQFFFVYVGLSASVVAIWMVTSVWISISVTTIKNRQGWPQARFWLTVAITVVIFALAIALCSYQAYTTDARWMFLVTAICIIIMLIFCIVSSFVIINRLVGSSISNAKKRVRRLAFQLVIVSFVCLLAIVALLILVFLPASLFTSFVKYYWLEVFLPAVAQNIFLITLVFFFRLSEWKTKAAKRSASGSSGSALSARSNREDTFKPGDISQLEDESGGASDTQAATSTSKAAIGDQFEEGVIAL